MKTLLIATTNKGKLKEIIHILEGVSYTVKSLVDIGFTEDIAETGGSFAENAKIKAATVGRKTGLLTVADDSGLEIDFLAGAPGVYSARFASGEGITNVEKVLKEMVGVPEEKRTARFVCSIALFDPEKNKTHIFEGESKGRITEKKIGTNGFDYDPIFYNFDLGKTNAEVTLEDKNTVSHRARALSKLKEFLLSKKSN